MKNTSEDYTLYLKNITIKYDNTSAICLSKNHIQHSWTKHINIRYHFIRDHISIDDIFLYFVDTKHQQTNIFNKPLSEKQFDFIIMDLDMLNLNDWILISLKKF